MKKPAETIKIKLYLSLLIESIFTRKCSSINVYNEPISTPGSWEKIVTQNIQFVKSVSELSH